MRRVLLTLLIASLGACRADELTYAGIRWGSGVEQVRRVLAERGYDYLAPANEHGDHLFAGTYAERKALLVVRMAAGRVAKIEIGVVPEAGERAALYQRLESRLDLEYGSGPGTVRVEGGNGAARWLPGDPGRPERRSVWSRVTARGESFLILEDRPELAIVVSFESPDWHDEFQRRRP